MRADEVVDIAGLYPRIGDEGADLVRERRGSRFVVAVFDENELIDRGTVVLGGIFREGGDRLFLAHDLEKGHYLAAVVEFEQRFYAEQSADGGFQPAQPAAAVERAEVLDDEEVVVAHGGSGERVRGLVEAHALVAHGEGVAHHESLTAAAREAVQHAHPSPGETAFELACRGSEGGVPAAHARGEGYVQHIFTLLEVGLEDLDRVVRGDLRGGRGLAVAHPLVKFLVAGDPFGVTIGGADAEGHGHHINAPALEEPFGHIRRHIRRYRVILHNCLRCRARRSSVRL